MRLDPIKLAVLVSGAGTTLGNLLECIRGGTLSASVEIVIGSRPDLVGLQRAAAADLRVGVIDRRRVETVAAFSQQVFMMCDAAGVELVCLAGWLCLLEIPQRYEGRVMNIHPALLPAFGGKGMYGRHVHEAVLAHGCKVSGCTVHFVDNAYDAGPIILQSVCEVRHDDTPTAIAARVFELETRAYPQAIELYRQGRLRVRGRVVEIVDQ